MLARQQEVERDQPGMYRGAPAGGGLLAKALDMSPAGSFTAPKPAKPGGGSFNVGSYFQGGAPGTVAPTFKPVNPALAGVGGDTSAMIERYLKGVVEGGQTRYSDDVVNRLKSEAKSSAMGSAKASRDIAMHNAAQRGTFRSNAEDRAIGAGDRAAEQSYSSAVNQIGFQKANADFEDRMAALDRAQKWLDQLRNHSLAVEGLSADKEKSQAAISLAYARLDQARQSLQAQLGLQGEQLGLQNRQFDFYKWMNSIPTANGTPIPSTLLPTFTGGY